MAVRRPRAMQRQVLHPLGISDAEEQVYRALLARPGATAQELARTLALGTSKVQRSLNEIVLRGLATHSLDRPRRHFAAEPNVVLEALVAERQEELRHSRSAIAELQNLMVAAQATTKQVEMAELIHGREAGRRIIEQMDRTAQHEILALLRPPILISQADESESRSSQRDAQARGVHFRSIANHEYLALPGVAGITLNDMKAGEEVRVIDRLPFKMILVDRRMAFVPLNLQKPDSPSLLVRSSALLDALYEIFEMLWERASSISFSVQGDLIRGQMLAPDMREEDALVTLLAAGLNDKAIASELGISYRTLGRYFTRLENKLGSKTRFQAGWIAAQRLAAAQAISGKRRAHKLSRAAKRRRLE